MSATEGSVVDDLLDVITAAAFHQHGVTAEELGVHISLTERDHIEIAAREDNPVVRVHCDWHDDSEEELGRSMYFLFGDLQNGNEIVAYLTEEAFVQLFFELREQYRNLAQHRKAQALRKTA